MRIGFEKLGRMNWEGKRPFWASLNFYFSKFCEFDLRTKHAAERDDNELREERRQRDEQKEEDREKEKSRSERRREDDRRSDRRRDRRMEDDRPESERWVEDNFTWKIDVSDSLVVWRKNQNSSAGKRTILLVFGIANTVKPILDGHPIGWPLPFTANWQCTFQWL